VKTYVYRSVTLTSYTGGGESSKPALSPFGLVRVGLTTKHARLTQKAIPDLVLTELLSYLEKQSQILENKLSAVSNTLNTDIQPRVERLVSTTARTGTK
jgi:hypothetical protein